jgi:NitT/TauT family transport system ATP-binding protein
MSQPETVSEVVAAGTIPVEGAQPPGDGTSGDGVAPASAPEPTLPVTPSITDHALRFDHVSMVFPDGTHAVDDVSLGVRPGEFVTIVGPSGCGKSTLLRIASGLETNTGGTMFVLRKSLGYVFQDATLLPWRTVGKNVELLAELQGVDKATREKLVRSTIDLVGLQGFEAKYPKQLSGGMRMRASLARSLVLEPKVFLFDEPFGALDEITRERLNGELLRLFQLEGFAALFITHSITEAVFLSTRVAVMSARPGRILGEFDVPFPYPRTHDLRYDPEFAKLSGEISHALRGAHE